MFGDFHLDTQTAAVILAAGYSSRMGSHKALLRFDKDNDFIQKIVSLYANEGVDRMVVVVNRDNEISIKTSLQAAKYSGVQIVLNPHPEWERFYSIRCGLSAVEGMGKCFIHNCDNPFVEDYVVRKLLLGFVPRAVTLPEFEGRRGHPVLLSADIIQAVLGHSENSCNFKTFLDNFSVNVVQVDTPSILFNINTREDLQNSMTK